VVRLGLEFQEVLRSKQCCRVAKKPERVGSKSQSQILAWTKFSRGLFRRDLADAMDCKFFKASQNADSKVTQRANKKMGQNGRWHFLQLAFRLGISHQRVFYGNDF